MWLWWIHFKLFKSKRLTLVSELVKPIILHHALMDLHHFAVGYGEQSLPIARFIYIANKRSLANSKANIRPIISSH